MTQPMGKSIVLGLALLAAIGWRWWAARPGRGAERRRAPAGRDLGRRQPRGAPDVLRRVRGHPAGECESIACVQWREEIARQLGEGRTDDEVIDYLWTVTGRKLPLSRATPPTA